MPCKHRFYEDLIPQRAKVEFLIVGTFNPEWNAANDNNAEYFYGRASNLFWCICPHAFNDNCLIDKGANEWKEFCFSHNIVLTDIIREVLNADLSNIFHKELLTVGFQDKNLDLMENGNRVFDLDFNTNQIKHFITDNQHSLKGVFFTRNSKGEIPRIWQNWLNVQSHCNQLKIYNSALPTPSARGRNSSIRAKITTWRKEIQSCI